MSEHPSAIPNTARHAKVLILGSELWRVWLCLDWQRDVQTWDFDFIQGLDRISFERHNNSIFAYSCAVWRRIRRFRLNSKYRMPERARRWKNRSEEHTSEL